MCCAGAHVPDRTGLLAVTGQPGRRQEVERGAVGPAGQQRLADARAAVEALERPDVEVLTRVRAGHDRELGRFEVEGGDPAGLDEGQQTERLDRRAQGDDAVGVAQLPDDSSRRIGLHDVAAVDALLDAAAELAREDRRGDPALSRATRRRTPRPGGGWHGGCGHDRWISGCAGDGRLFEGEDTPPIVTMTSCPPRTSTSRSIRPFCTSSRSSGTSGRSPRSSARSCASCRGCWAMRRSPTSASARSRSALRSSR